VPDDPYLANVEADMTSFLILEEAGFIEPANTLPDPEGN
jgi:hypothetical protein